MRPARSSRDCRRSIAESLRGFPKVADRLRRVHTGRIGSCSGAWPRPVHRPVRAAFRWCRCDVVDFDAVLAAEIFHVPVTAVNRQLAMVGRDVREPQDDVAAFAPPNQERTLHQRNRVTAAHGINSPNIKCLAIAWVVVQRCEKDPPSGVPQPRNWENTILYWATDLILVVRRVGSTNESPKPASSRS